MSILCRLTTLPFPLLRRSMSSSTSSSLLVEHTPSGVLHLALARPPVNALGRQLVSDMEAMLAPGGCVSAASVRAVVLSSSSTKVFCAGADLKERKGMTETEASYFVERLRKLTGRLAAVAVPTIAAINGAALGGGLEVALACDIRVAARSARLALPETKLGIIPGAGGTQRLPRLIGVSQAKLLTFTGKEVNGEEAMAMGLVNEVSEDGQAVTRALEIAETIASNGPLGVRMAKSAIDGGVDAGPEACMHVESFCYDRVLRSDDRLEALKAFAEKRPPVFTGN